MGEERHRKSGKEGEEKMKLETEKMEIVVYTQKHRIEGQVHVRQGSRFSDFFSADAQKFISVTDAKIFDLETGAKLYEARFLQLNRENIIMALPADQIIGREGSC